MRTRSSARWTLPRTIAAVCTLLLAAPALAGGDLATLLNRPEAEARSVLESIAVAPSVTGGIHELTLPSSSRLCTLRQLSTAEADVYVLDGVVTRVEDRRRPTPLGDKQAAFAFLRAIEQQAGAKAQIAADGEYARFATGPDVVMLFRIVNRGGVYTVMSTGAEIVTASARCDERKANDAERIRGEAKAQRADDDADRRQRCEAGDIDACSTLARTAPAPTPAALSRVCTAFDATDCEKKCAVGQPDSCVVFGKMLVDGNRVPKSKDKALSAFSRACDLGVGVGCTQYAKTKSWLVKVTPDAVAAFQKGCDLGDAEGCYQAAIEVDARRQSAERQRLLSKACDAGSADGCSFLAGESEGDTSQMVELYAKTLRLRQAACDAGDASECIILALKYGIGDTAMPGVPAARKRALQMRSNEGAKKDPKKVKALVAEAIAVLTRDCNLGDLRSCNALGEFIDPAGSYAGNSFKPKPNAAEMMKAYALGCDGNYGPACANLGGHTKDKAKAFALHVKACDLLDGEGCAGAARATRDGSGTKKDAARSKELFLTACANGWVPESSSGGGEEEEAYEPEEFVCPAARARGR